MNDLLESQLIDAAKSGNLSLVKMLVEEEGADPLNSRVYNAARRYAEQSGNYNIIDYLVGEGSEFVHDYYDCDDAVMDGYPNIMKYCYDKKLQGRVSKKDYLCLIINMELIDTFKDIVENNDISDDDINDLFICAATWGQLKILKYLSTKKVVDAKTLNLAFLESLKPDEIEYEYVVRYLVEKGVDINTINKAIVIVDNFIKHGNENNRSFLKPYADKNYRVVYYLLSKGANFSLLSEDTKEKMRQMREKVLALAPSLGVDLSRKVGEYVFGKKRSKKYSKRTLKKRSKKHLKKRSKKSSFK